MKRNSFEEDYIFEVIKIEGKGYSVSLPHQCDDWEIIGADIGSRDYGGGPKETDEWVEYGNVHYLKDKDKAISYMELFIKRATEALEKLKKLN